MSDRLTMADIRRISLRSGNYYFTRDTKRFFGPERFWGPYSGSGGIYFVKSGKSGIVVERFHRESGRIDYVQRFDHLDDARDHAKALAHGTARSHERRRRSSRSSGRKTSRTSEGPSLHAALRQMGYEARSGAHHHGKKRIVRLSDGREVGEMSAHEAWSFLRRQRIRRGRRA